MEKEKRKKPKDLDREERNRTLLKIAISVVLVGILCWINWFLPFRTLLPGYAFPPREEGEMRVHFLDVGQADATVVEFPSGEVLVIDSGNGDFLPSNKIYRVLRGLHPTRISLLASHADVDHCGGMYDILRRLPVDKIYLPMVPAENRSFYDDLLEETAKRQTETDILSRYDVIDDPSGAYAVCISPYSIDETKENDSSTVLYLTYAGTSLLFCGDISSVRERRLIREYHADPTIFDSGNYSVRLDETDILHVAHHGSSSSTCEEWLSLLGVKSAVISCGENSYGHPNSGTLRRLSEQVDAIYRTDELGDILLSVTSDGYRIERDNFS